ncbi:hypothetical protein DUI87_02547 [Hirundo rustica rustica]|uniref:Uncharacterized protein n=1 Tax=Hirundo rustica rustica TaxID=333673 RepID=A0A3M0L830_HIRRU|nr:hypothetical protein DUI87_02547 [Hirundo rustica rustica]
MDAFPACSPPKHSAGDYLESKKASNLTFLCNCKNRLISPGTTYCFLKKGKGPRSSTNKTKYCGEERRGEERRGEEEREREREKRREEKRREEKKKKRREREEKRREEKRREEKRREEKEKRREEKRRENAD